MGIGDGDWGPIPNPQSPIPNPQSPIIIIYFIIFDKMNRYIYEKIYEIINL